MIEADNGSDAIREWEQAFAKGGICGQALMPVMRAEQEHFTIVTERALGLFQLSDSFLAFHLQTLGLAKREYESTLQPNTPQGYWPMLLSEIARFKRFRACQIVLSYGYPLGGYALLRDLKDTSLVLGALAAGLTTYSKMSGTERTISRDSISTTDFIDICRRRETEEKRLVNLMSGEQSCLPPDTINALTLWGKLFHLEVHGSRFTSAMCGTEWIERKGDVSMGPKYDQNAVLMYLGSFSRVAWLAHRVLPFFQTAAGSFGKDWARKWAILDGVFRYWQASHTGEGKQIADAIVALADTKFPFSPDKTFYHE